MHDKLRNTDCNNFTQGEHNAFVLFCFVYLLSAFVMKWLFAVYNVNVTGNETNDNVNDNNNDHLSSAAIQIIVYWACIIINIPDVAEWPLRHLR